MKDYNFDKVIQDLRARQESIRNQLQGDYRTNVVKKADAERMYLIGLKKNIDDAIRCLKLCEEFGLSPGSSIRQIPDNVGHESYFTRFQVVDACCEVREHWTIIDSDARGREIYLHQGDLIINK